MELEKSQGSSYLYLLQSVLKFGVQFAAEKKGRLLRMNEEPVEINIEKNVTGQCIIRKC